MDGNGKFICQKCGETYQMNMPCPIEVMVGAGKGFSEIHKRHLDEEEYGEEEAQEAED
jgi:tRNA(Ile2) C34 agmatinyltransferase TiaS